MIVDVVGNSRNNCRCSIVVSASVIENDIANVVTVFLVVAVEIVIVNIDVNFVAVSVVVVAVAAIFVVSLLVFVATPFHLPTCQRPSYGKAASRYCADFYCRAISAAGSV